MRPTARILACTGLAALLLIPGCGCSSKKAGGGALPPTNKVLPVGSEPAPTAKGEPKVATVDLETSETPEDPKTGAGPKHKMRLVVTLTGEAPQTTELGEFQGACSSAQGDAALVTIKCWWAGSGDDLRIVKDGDALVVTDTQQDEQMEGQPEAKEIARVKLPAGTEIKLAPMEGATGN